MTRAERFSAIATLGMQLAGHCEALEADDALPDELRSALQLAGVTMRYACETAHAAAVGALQPALVQPEGAWIH
jgi:hypothetical protein